MNPYQQLQHHERRHIYRMLKAKCQLSHIAEFLGRSRSTISREVNRNTTDTGYHPDEAQEFTLQRRSCSRQKIKGLFAQDIIQALERGFSPDQIVMKNPLLGVSTQSIYGFIWRDRAQGGSLWKLLRHCGRGPRTRFYRRTHGQARRSRNKDYTIDFRPPHIHSRLRYGHWEADLVEPRGRKRPLLVLIERKSRYTLSAFLKGKWSDEVARVSQQLLKNFKVFSLTCDNGPEFLDRELISNTLHCKVYYTHPYKSWQKGAVENVNKLYREFFPKGESFSHIPSEKPQEASLQINNRPRRSLQAKSPQQLIKHLLLNP